MSSVGQILREERQRQGLELPKIAQQTRINLGYLQAIEADDPSKLPGGFFYRSFVRQYGEFLGLDDDSLDALADRIAASQSAPGFGADIHVHDRIDVPPLPRPHRSSDTRRFSWALVLLVVAIGGSGGLYVLWQRAQEPRRETPPPAPVTATHAPPPSAAPASTAAPPPGAAGQAAPAPSGVPAAPPPSAQPSAPPAESQPSPAPAGTTAAAATATSPVIEFMATEDVWVSATADGKEVVSRILKPGESRTVKGVEKVSLLTGNAGGLVITANGKLIDKVGPRGQIRIVDVTPLGVEVRGPTPKKPAPPDSPPSN